MWNKKKKNTTKLCIKKYKTKDNKKTKKNKRNIKYRNSYKKKVKNNCRVEIKIYYKEIRVFKKRPITASWKKKKRRWIKKELKKSKKKRQNKIRNYIFH